VTPEADSTELGRKPADMAESMAFIVKKHHSRDSSYHYQLENKTLYARDSPDLI